MNLFRRFKNWLNEKPKVNDLPNRVVKITFEYDTGLTRTLEGDAAKEWVKDLFSVSTGWRVDWTRHKWNNTWKS